MSSTDDLARLMAETNEDDRGTETLPKVGKEASPPSFPNTVERERPARKKQATETAGAAGKDSGSAPVPEPSADASEPVPTPEPPEKDAGEAVADPMPGPHGAPPLVEPDEGRGEPAPPDLAGTPYDTLLPSTGVWGVICTIVMLVVMFTLISGMIPVGRGVALAVFMIILMAAVYVCVDALDAKRAADAIKRRGCVVYGLKRLNPFDCEGFGWRLLFMDDTGVCRDGRLRRWEGTAYLLRDQPRF